MEMNALPAYDMTDNPTGCCPRFDPGGWDNQELHFRDKLFLKATTRSLFHIPLNMGAVFKRVFEALDKGARDDDDFIVLSRDPSPWSAEHYFAVKHDVAGEEMARLSGDYVTRVFEGPYKEVPNWQREMTADLEAQGKGVKMTYFFYTTCPKCAKQYGKNYVVGVAEIN